MVRNLVENAIRHNILGGHVDIAIERSRTGVELIVENSGNVIDRTTLDSLAVPFTASRSAAPGAYRGFGLGLSIARTIAERHGGRLELSARAEGGLRVRLHLTQMPQTQSRQTILNESARA